MRTFKKTSEPKNIYNNPDIDSYQEKSSAAVMITRNQAKKEKTKRSPLIVPTPEIVDKETFKEFQRDDPSLQRFWKLAGQKSMATRGGAVRYMEEAGLLFRLFERHESGNTAKQLLVPQKLTGKVLSVAHDGLLSGHCGIKRTLERVVSNFYWKDVSNDVRRYCRSCDVCQKTVPKGRQGKAPLQRMPVIREPFLRVAVDLVGPIVPCSEGGHRFIIIVVDYATRYPEAESLRNIDTITVAEALVNIFCRARFPEEILTDQGTQFMSDTLK